MARRAADRLAAIAGVDARHAARPDGDARDVPDRRLAAQEALEELGARVFAVARTVPLIDALRISVGCFNSEAELERFVERVELLAAHTPETIPPRRTLTILSGG